MCLLTYCACDAEADALVLAEADALVLAEADAL
ncbi:hypothetical protein SPAR162_1648, partial [Streptococcus pneumoniae GA60190]